MLRNEVIQSIASEQSDCIDNGFVVLLRGKVATKYTYTISFQLIINLATI